jgi:hypothetical protein
MAITTGIAMTERSTNICQSTKSALNALIAASPSDSARSVTRMTATPSVTLSALEACDTLKAMHSRIQTDL